MADDRQAAFLKTLDEYVAAQADETLPAADLPAAARKRVGRQNHGGMRAEEVGFALREAFEAGGRAITDDAIVRAAEASAGYPYLIRLIAHYLWRAKKDLIGVTETDKAIFLAKIELFKNIHDPLFWGLSSKDRFFLWAMSKDEFDSEFGEIAKRMGVSAGYASKYRERLLNAELIYASAYGRLAFTLPYMREYVGKDYIERLGGEGGKDRE
ncbi:MAG: hypothetical protein LBN12_09070 [Clostridiales Family XIII bacterium]|jgi:hypothetical protein|nr:hypothetical protein [Clostridiales Family XIII bacterium]